MLYVNNYGELAIASTPTEVALQSLNQELSLYKGENPMDTDAGVNYTAVLNGEAFLKTEVENVVNKYLNKFQSIEVGEANTVNNVISIPITIREFNSIAPVNLEVTLG